MKGTRRMRELVFYGRAVLSGINFTQDRKSIGDAPLVEPDGIEPTTSCLQSRRSPN
jgi:hypothetical protein